VSGRCGLKEEQMGMSVGQSGGRRGRRRGRGSRSLMSEINVTPMVDVMLVLLIIFMVAAPMMTVGVPIDLPETQAKPLNAETQPITVSVQQGGKVFLQETEIPVEEVVPKLEAIAKTGYEERIYVRGDKAADYGTVMQVMARISAAGFKNIGLVTLQEQDQ
jgi:biopolymer transport protein TolR